MFCANAVGSCGRSLLRRNIVFSKIYSSLNRSAEGSSLERIRRRGACAVVLAGMMAIGAGRVRAGQTPGMALMAPTLGADAQPTAEAPPVAPAPSDAQLAAEAQPTKMSDEQLM